MPHWRTLMDSELLRACDLDGRDVTVTIAKVEGGSVTAPGGKRNKKPLLWFVESKTGKPFVANSTNCKTIEGLYGGDYTAWIGKRVTLYPTTTSNPERQTVDCIRIRPVIPPEKAPKPADQAEKESDA